MREKRSKRQFGSEMRIAMLGLIFVHGLHQYNIVLVSADLHPQYLHLSLLVTVVRLQHLHPFSETWPIILTERGRSAAQ